MRRPSIVLVRSNGIQRTLVPGRHHVGEDNGANYMWWREWGMVCVKSSLVKDTLTKIGGSGWGTSLPKDKPESGVEGGKGACSSKPISYRAGRGYDATGPDEIDANFVCVRQGAIS